MGATLEWDAIPFTLETPAGDVPMNVDDALGSAGDGGLFLIDRTKSRMGFDLRVSVDDNSQTDGSIPHQVLASGYRAVITVGLWADRENVACGETLVEMNDLLMRCLNSLRDDGQGRLLWTPSGHDQRMLDDLWWVENAQPDWEGLLATVAFGMISAFPYAMIAAETTTAIDDGNTEVLVNTGSSKFWPVVRAYPPGTGSLTLMTIANAANDQQLIYDSSLPGAVPIGPGAYLELDFARDKAYLNGDVANRKAGIDVLASNFFPLEIGNNSITVTGADIDVLWQSAFA